MMKLLFFPFAIFLVAATVSAEPGDVRPYAYKKEVRGGASATELGVLELDAEVFRETRADFSDLRLMAVSGETREEISFLVVPRQREEESASRVLPAEIVRFEERSDGSIETTLKLDRATGAALLRLETPLRDFEKDVRVDGSHDGESWTPLVDSALVFDYRRFLDFRRTEIALPANEFPYFRVTVAAATDQQQSLAMTLRETVSDASGRAVESARVVEERLFKIDRFLFFTAAKEGEKAAPTMPFPVALVSVEHDTGEKETTILLDAGRAPLEEIVVSTADTNFRRDVALQEPQGEGWRTVARTAIYRFEIGDFSEEDLSIAIPPAAARKDQYRLVISQGDSAPVTVSAAEGTGLIHELYFVGGMEGELELYFGAGDGAVAKPVYDVAAIRAARGRVTEQARFEAGPLRENPVFTGVRTPFPWQDQKWMLWTVIALVVAGLGWILAGSAKRVEEID